MLPSTWLVAWGLAVGAAEAKPDPNPAPAVQTAPSLDPERCAAPPCAQLAVDPWIGAALVGLVTDPAAACTEGATSAGDCAEIAAQAQKASRDGASLVPVATHARGDRLVAVVDWVEAGEVHDRVWMYAVGSPAQAKLDAVDESPRHAAAYLAGAVPARGTPPASPALAAWATTFLAAPDPATRVPRGSELVGTGAFGPHGALCLDTPAGGMVVTVAATDAAGTAWTVVRASYRAGCRLTVTDVL